MTDRQQGSDRAVFAALVLAGRRGPSDPVASASRLSHKCLVEVAGVPMLQRVLEALRDCALVGPIAVSIDRPEVLAGLPWIAEEEVAVLASGPTPSASVLAGIRALGAPFPVLVTTADHALLTPAMAEHFCAEAVAAKADIVAGLTAASVIQARYPETRRTYLRFRDDRYSGANLFAVMNGEGLKAVEFWRRVEADRKRPWRIVKAFGPRALIAYLCGRLSLDQAFERISDQLGVRAAAVRMPQAEAAIDVDRPADLELVEEILRRGG